jgi:hypothetical protein
MDNQDKQIAECSRIIMDNLLANMGILAFNSKGKELLVKTSTDILMNLIYAEKIEGVRFTNETSGNL